MSSKINVVDYFFNGTDAKLTKYMTRKEIEEIMSSSTMKNILPFGITSRDIMI